MTETRAPYPTTTHRAFIAIPTPPKVNKVRKWLDRNHAELLSVATATEATKREATLI